MFKNLIQRLFQLDNKLPRNSNQKLGRTNKSGYTASLPDFIRHDEGTIMIRTDGKLYRLTRYDKIMLFFRMISLDNFDQMIINDQ